MKQILTLLYIISFSSYAQSSVETVMVHEQKTLLTTEQRIQLNAFESLRVIDTDEKRSYVFRNGKWEKEFSDAEIMVAQNQQQTIKNTNASWKEFDELSRPIDAGIPKSTTLSVPSANAKTSQIFYYQAIGAKGFYQNGFNLKVPDGKRVCFLKVYFKKTPESDEVNLENSKARKTLSDKLISFKYFESGLSTINFKADGINKISSDNNEILGFLLAYTD